MLNAHYASLVDPLALSRHFRNQFETSLVWVLTYCSLFRAQSENLGYMLVTIEVLEIPGFC